MAWSGEPLPEAGSGWRGAEFVGSVGAGVLTKHPPLEPGGEWSEWHEWSKWSEWSEWSEWSKWSEW